MAETTFEEAKRCPKCGKPGDDKQQYNKRSGKTGEPVVVHVIYCRTPLCPWVDTCWVVQVNSDGSIPQPGSQLGEKLYPKLSPETETNIRASLEQQGIQETTGHGEVRNPHSR